jgi:hypothetical protein
MVKRLTSLVAAAVVAVGLTVLGHPAPAGATAGSVDLPHGDAPAAIDITKFSVDNAERAFSLQVQVRNLARRGGRFEFYYWGGPLNQTPPDRSLLIIVSSVGGHARTKFRTCDTEVCLPDKCLGLRAHWDEANDRVSVSAPQSCYPRGGRDPVPLDTGRFFVGSLMGRVSDDGPSDPLQLTRG